MLTIPIDQVYGRKVLLLWKCRAHRAAVAHYAQSQSYKGWDFFLTVTNAMASLAVLFMTNAEWLKDLMSNNKPVELRKGSYEIINGGVVVYDLPNTHLLYIILTSIAGFVLVMTTILQYIRKDNENSKSHKTAGGEFSNLQRKIERYLLNEEFDMFLVHNINRDYSQITRSYKITDGKYWSSKYWAKKGRNDLRDISETIRNLEKDILDKYTDRSENFYTGPDPSQP